MTRYVALLRGINLGATRRVSMPDLRRVLTAAGYADVATLLQSGNVALSATARPRELERELSALLANEFGFEIAVLVRTADELAAVVADDPFGGEWDDAARYQVSFLDSEPAAARVRALEAAAVAPERVAVRGREVHAWHPGGIGRSELAKAISKRRLGVGLTARNRRTLTKLLELAEGIDE